MQFIVIGVICINVTFNDYGIGRQARHLRFFAFFLISVGKGSPLIDYSEIILTLRDPGEFNHLGGGHGGGGGGATWFSNDHPTYIRLGHSSVGLGHYSVGQAKRASQGFIQF